MDKLDMNQVVSVVRGEIAKRAAYVHLDQVLTEALDAQNAVAAAKKELAETMQLVQAKRREYEGLEKQAHLMVSEKQKELADLQLDHEKRCREVLAKVENAAIIADQAAAASLATEAATKSRIAELEKIVAALDKQRVEAMKELNRVHSEMAKLSAALKV